MSDFETGLSAGRELEKLEAKKMQLLEKREKIDKELEKVGRSLDDLRTHIQNCHDSLKGRRHYE